MKTPVEVTNCVVHEQITTVRPNVLWIDLKNLRDIVKATEDLDDNSSVYSLGFTPSASYKDLWFINGIQVRGKVVPVVD